MQQQIIQTTPATTPLPTAWARAIANSISSTLRTGWQPSRGTRDLTNSNRSGGHSTATKVPPPHPTTEILFNQPYAIGTIPANAAYGHPRLIWHLRQTRLIGAVPDQHKTAVERFLKQRPPSGSSPEPFRRGINRHGRITLRRNTDYAPPEIALALQAVAQEATVLTMDEHEYQLALALLEADHAGPLDWFELLEDAIVEHAAGLDRVSEFGFVL